MILDRNGTQAFGLAIRNRANTRSIPDSMPRKGSLSCRTMKRKLTSPWSVTGPVQQLDTITERLKAFRSFTPDTEAKLKRLVSDLSLSPGHFGRFPANLSIHSGTKTADRKKETFFLCIGSPEGWLPIDAVSRFCAWSKHAMTLYSEPLACVGIEKSFVGKMQLILPGT